MGSRKIRSCIFWKISVGPYLYEVKIQPAPPILNHPNLLAPAAKLIKERPKSTRYPGFSSQRKKDLSFFLKITKLSSFYVSAYNIYCTVTLLHKFKQCSFLTKSAFSELF